MKEKNSRLKGRPPLEKGRRTRKIDVRFTEEEYQLVLDLERTLGLSRTEIIRIRVLKVAARTMVNTGEITERLDGIGAELGRSGNNINQLARYANTLMKQNFLSEQVAERFCILLDRQTKVQLKLEDALRKIVRELSG